MENKKQVTRNLLGQEPGRKKRHASAANSLKIAYRETKRHHTGTPYRVTPGWKRGCRVNKLQILYLHRLHGLTEAQAHGLAVLIWGASY
ncbi:hypothetical protein AB2B41_20990 [Marimonas sp. MJW-29]|uniref:Uncharacterized protein n=1 Tax=Sulfitobacter sediminis TaxID=3234186 RepID=A0ABV3RSW6_9RHOB